MIKSRENYLGAWTFLIGVVLAVTIGLVSSTLISIPFFVKYNTQIYAILALLGIFTGFLNVTGRDSQTFMIAGTVIVIVSRFGMEGVKGSLIGIGIGDIVSAVFAALLALFAPATIIVALKSVFSRSNI